jgi:hypothetical protein
MHSISSSDENLSEYSYSSISVSTSSGYSTSSSGAAKNSTKVDETLIQRKTLPMGNLDRYLYNERKQASEAVELDNKVNEQFVLETVQQFVQHQSEFIETLGIYLETYIRPLSFLIDTDTFFSIFQNIEKIHRTSECLKRSIQSAYQQTRDLPDSLLHVIYENLQMLLGIYELYLNGYKQATGAANKWYPYLLKKVSLLHDQHNCLFDLKKILELPVLHFAKIYITFRNLNETQRIYVNELTRTTFIFRQLKEKISAIEINEFVDSRLRTAKQEASLAEANQRRKMNDKHSQVVNFMESFHDRWNDFDGIKLYYV